MDRATPLVMSMLLALPLTAQSPLADARAALDAGHAWRASQLVAPLLATSAQRTPEVVLVAAEAAARWEGWDAVRTLLEKEGWIDTLFDRRARRLLTEAALGANRTADALTHARRAAAGGPRDSAEQGLRLALLGRAFDRAGIADSAAHAYARASRMLPVVAEWLALRAAGVTSNAPARQTLYASVVTPPAQARIPWTEALALERFGDKAMASEQYARLGATAISLRLRWEAATTDAVRNVLTDALLAQLRPGVAVTPARDALILIERLPVPITNAQRLIVARRAAEVGRAAQAVDAFARVAKSAPLSSSDRYLYGTALGTLNRWPEAAVQFRGVTAPALAGRAAYAQARALLRAGNAGAAITALERVVANFPGDTVAAATALYLLGDLAIDAGTPAAAGRRFSAIARGYPTSAFAPRAALLAGLVPFAAGDHALAARELERSAATFTRGVDADAIRYWLARAHHATGRRAAGDSILRTLIDRGPESYYATRAAARLDTLPWRAEPSNAAPGMMAAPFARVALLERLGLDTEARYELDAIAASPSNSDSLLIRAEAMFAHGHVARASQLANRALTAGAPRDGRSLRLIYPLPWASTLRLAGEKEGVDPLLAASVIRQESAFQPRATSRTDARGLMQVMPTVGRELGRSFGFANLDPALLWQAEVNIPLGMRHFGNALKRYPERERALAAYNAGQSRVNRWSATLLSGPRSSAVTAPLDDTELFVERIPFEETRDYVRVVLRNAAMYHMLYPRDAIP